MNCHYCAAPFTPCYHFRSRYEEEIARLRYELEMRGVHVPPLQPSFPYTEPAMIQQQQHQQFQQAQQDAFAQDFAQQQQPFGTHPQTVSQYGGLPQEQAILLQQGHNHMQQEPHPSLLQHPPHSTLNTSIAPIADGNATANRNKRMRVDDPLQQRQEQPPLERSMLQQLERPTLPAINIIPSQPETSSADCSQLIFGDVEPASIASSHQRQGDDWSIIFNPKLPRNVDTHLAHSFDHDSVVCCVRFSVDGKYLAAGSMRCAVIYDVESGVKLK